MLCCSQLTSTMSWAWVACEVMHASSLYFTEAPSVEKRRLNGEKRTKTGKLKNRGRARGDGKGQKRVPGALSFPFSPASARFIFPLPIPQLPERRKRPAEERARKYVVAKRGRKFSKVAGSIHKGFSMFISKETVALRCRLGLASARLTERKNMKKAKTGLFFRLILYSLYSRLTFPASAEESRKAQACF